MATTRRKPIKKELYKLRLDKWLWAARFFKTRQLASEAVSGGKVHVNTVRVKPAKNVVCGDELKITRGMEVFEVVVLGLNDKRRPASEARELYEESADSIESREKIQLLRKLAGDSVSPGRCPDKRERRKIHRFKQGVE